MLIFGTTDIRYLRSDMADNQYQYPISDRINYVTMIAGFVNLAISRRPEVGLAISCNSNTYTNAHRPTRRPLGKQCRMAIIISKMVILMILTRCFQPYARNATQATYVRSGQWHGKWLSHDMDCGKLEHCISVARRFLDLALRVEARFMLRSAYSAISWRTHMDMDG